MLGRKIVAVLVAGVGLLGVALGITSLGGQVQNAPNIADLRIVQAWYGDPNGQGKDVTSIVASSFARGDAAIAVNNSVFGDTALGAHKELWLQYRVSRKLLVVEIQEGGSVDFASLVQGASKSSGIQIVSATYQGVDVTKRVAAMVASGQVTIPVWADSLGISDPAPGVVKTLTVTVRLVDGSTRVLSAQDGGFIPLGSLMPLKVMAAVVNGSFSTEDGSMFASDQSYVPAGNGVLTRPGTFTISQGILRPFQLNPKVRADFVEHTGRPGSMAMWICPSQDVNPCSSGKRKSPLNR